MADSLGELLAPYLGRPDGHGDKSSATSFEGRKYLTRLTTLSLDALQTTEPQSLAQSSHTISVSIQALANRSNKSIIAATDSLGTLHTSLPILNSKSSQLRNAVPRLDEEAVRFSTTYSKSGQNAILDRRKQAMLLARNVDRVSDILELPTLLSTTIASSSITSSTASASSGTNFSNALDLFAHIKRLQILYPSSTVIRSVLAEAEDAMKEMTSNLIGSLRSQQNIRLAAAIRMVGWLRRVAPDLSTAGTDQGRRSATAAQEEGSFGALFLVCRLANLLSMLDALAPLRDLADQESGRRLDSKGSSGQTSIAEERKSSVSRGRSDVYLSGQQSERFLKRYIEIFREHVFATISMYKNIFPTDTESGDDHHLGFLTLPPALQTFPMHVIDLLLETLKLYMPNIKDDGARESLLTQVLYTAGSLGRLGADFGSMISLLFEEESEVDNEGSQTAIPEWQNIMKKHRIQTGRLEALASGRGLA